MNELVLDINHLEKTYLSKQVLNIEELKVYEGEKIGIVGGNGQGKSTLLKLIAGIIEPDKGTVDQKIDFAYYEQIFEDVSPDYETIDPQLLSELQVPSHNVQHFSGSESTRLRLAEFFSTYAFGLLMDEPTTHLDFDGVEFLINQLKYYYGTLLVISHDRYFLDQVVETIWEVNDGKVSVYHGNYSTYQAQKEEEMQARQQAFDQYEKEKTRLEQAAKQQAQKAQQMSKVSQKQQNRSVKPDRLSSSKQKDTVQKNAHKTAKAIEKRAEQLEEVQAVDQHQQIEFPTPKSLEMHNDFPIMADQLTLKKGDRVLLKEQRFQFPLGKRIAIIGPNGSGKSTLLKHIMTDGEGITLSKKIAFKAYGQMSYKLTSDKSMLAYLQERSDFEEPLIRAILNNLGFDQLEVSNKAVKDLSGGEATRLVIANLFTEPSNVLILDEPTNFIDIETIEALEHLMKSYKGTILFTSHDKYFVENVAEQVWEIADQSLQLNVN